MRVFDLFSGIGGFSLGLERAGMETISFCEIDLYATSILNKHWPTIPVYKDIRSINGAEYKGKIDLLCGGFPCQDISIAGKHEGLKGKRSSLWFEFKRLIKEIKPKYVLIENVANLRSNGLVTILQDLWEIGYDAQWHIIPAQAFGAEHERERIWIVAHPNSSQRKGRGLSLRIQKELTHISNLRWGKDKPGVVRTFNGVPSQMDRLRCLGNSVIPQIPELLGRAIIRHDNEECS